MIRDLKQLKAIAIMLVVGGCFQNVLIVIVAIREAQMMVSPSLRAGWLWKMVPENIESFLVGFLLALSGVSLLRLTEKGRKICVQLLGVLGIVLVCRLATEYLIYHEKSAVWFLGGIGEIFMIPISLFFLTRPYLKEMLQHRGSHREK